MKIIIAYIILFCCLVNPAANAIESKDSPITEIKFSQYWKGEQDATPAMLSMLQEAKDKGISKVIIEPGEYHFYPEKAYEKYCYVPNHDNGLKRTAFPIIDMDNLHVQGHQVQLIFHGLMVPFIIEQSSNIKLEGVAIDWQIPLHSEVKVVANNEEEKSFDIAIPESHPYMIRNGELIFLKEGFEHSLETGILFDPEKQRVYYNTRDYTPIPYKSKASSRHKEALQPIYEPFLAYPSMMKSELQNRIEAEEIKSGLVRVYGSPKSLPPAGTIYACKGAGGTNRLAPAIYINKSSEIEFNGINIYHAAGMGIIAEGSKNISMNQVFIGVEDGSGRMVSTTADATHFLNCRGKITFDQCHFANQLDDATNVHGAYMIVEDVLDKQTLGVRVGHFQQQGLYFGDKGDRIGLVDQNKSVHAFQENHLEAIEKVNPGYYKLHFQSELKPNITKSMVVENLDAYPEVEITNCRFENNRARGILLSTPKKVIVEYNYFSNMMSAVLMPVELSYWYESGHSQDVIIRNNEFADCAYGGKDFPVINIHTTLDHSDFVFGKIVIENNRFRQFDAAIIRANGVQQLQFNNNNIEASGTYPALYPKNSTVEVNHIGNLTIKGNHFNGMATNKLSAKDIAESKIAKNKGIEDQLTTKK